ncbi:hypothetical protein FVA81_24000 [Rhizobium sp. WL3]|uniref:hypothetical protein n=1 Tax=Rhizobium sp. WL3 TaxID=2603277 RepID=UPI0011C1DD8B|nr:hypothetical protein [Rhizobium sp. WL3]QEE47479.1 hypothetical protein FVA81_24000 [Rhizobium sp. WL3]
MAFITVNKFADETSITINTEHIVCLEEASDGGTSILLTPPIGPGASLRVTVKQDYFILAKHLEKLK